MSCVLFEQQLGLPAVSERPRLIFSLIDAWMTVFTVDALR